MTKVFELETERLYIRQWKESDYSPFAKMSADERVMEFFPSVFTTEESDEKVNIKKSLIQKHGWGFWALEEKSSNKFIGFTGLHISSNELPFSPCIEIGWRIFPEYWGKGFATEAAHECLRFGFEDLNLDQIVSFAVKNNFKSLAVMERLGMFKDPENFEHPAIPIGHKLRQHSLYRLSKLQWRAAAV